MLYVYIPYRSSELATHLRDFAQVLHASGGGGSTKSKWTTSSKPKRFLSAKTKFGDHLDDSWMMAGFCWSDDRWMLFKVSNVSNGSPYLIFFNDFLPLESNQPLSGLSMDQIFDLDFQAHIPHVEPA